MTDPTLERGQALILVGPQGSGKSLMARRIAERHGPFKEVRAEDLVAPFRNHVLDDEPRTLIVDELPARPSVWMIAKTMLASRTVAVGFKGRPTRDVPSPHLIFCTQQAPRFGPRERRFKVVRLTTP